VIQAPQFGYRGDWMIATNDMTLLFDTGTPLWRSEALVEAAQFAASCSAQLLLWGQELLVSSKPDTATVGRLRTTQLACERFIAAITSNALCWSRAHRALIDVLLTTTGASGLADDLRRQLGAVQVLLNEDLREQRAKERADTEQRREDEHRRREREVRKREEADQNRNWLLGLIAVFGVCNLSTAFQLYNQSPRHVWELLSQVLFVVAALLVVIAVRPRGDRTSSTAPSPTPATKDAPEP
jgi:hypothetical protein